MYLFLIEVFRFERDLSVLFGLIDVECEVILCVCNDMGG